MADPTVLETIELFFENVAARGTRDPMLRRACGSCRFDVEGVGSWLLHADHGVISVDRVDQTTPADSTVTAGEGDLVRMARGEQNPRTAFMQGRLRISGNLALGDRFLFIFP